uniref:Uncharacterized protein n=1 Tax=Arundo donax TaxID=35708 RepID=A0A0A9HP86_ARUDO
MFRLEHIYMPLLPKISEFQSIVNCIIENCRVSLAFILMFMMLNIFSSCTHITSSDQCCCN